MVAKLTKRQEEILNHIQYKVEETGAPPTRAEIARHMGFKSPNAAEDHLRALARKGMIELIPSTSRGIRLMQNLNSGIPVIGKVAAGNPILSEENIESHCNVNNNLFKMHTDYFLKVQGDSMINVGINDGDLLAVHSQQIANNGEIVIARIDNEVTVKRFYKNDDAKVSLIAENDQYQPMQIDLTKQRLYIEGIAVGVVRGL